MAGFLTLRQITEIGLPLAALALIIGALFAYGIVLPWLAEGLLWLAILLN